MKFVIALFALWAVALSQDGGHHHHQGTSYYCRMSGAFNCTDHHGVNEVCATNKLTYRNRCYLSKAHCYDRSINLLHEGACTSDDLRTTPSPEEVQHSANIVYDVFCVHLSHTACAVPTTDEKICGTNNRTYISYCEYEKTHCTHRDVHVAFYGDCAA